MCLVRYTMVRKMKPEKGPGILLELVKSNKHKQQLHIRRVMN